MGGAISGPLWPIYPKPFPDELLSSWMVRIARAYRIRPASFWKRQAGSVDFRNVDLTAEDRLLRLIGLKTGTPLDRVRATTLRAYRECGVDWYGGHETVIRFCPACLEERPYFRRRWRLGFLRCAMCMKSSSRIGARVAAA
ncbi:MAG: TniQ family protein [Acidobacteriota bacterium]|nr:TniQ family protein [Acidobacteriota bacterium]